MYEIDSYKTASGKDEIFEYLTELGKKAQTDKSARILANKIDLYFRLFRKNGTRVGMPVTRHIEDDIWELRTIDERIFYAHWTGNKFILLHHFHKKSNKTPPLEIEQAKRNLKDWMERNGNNG